MKPITITLTIDSPELLNKLAILLGGASTPATNNNPASVTTAQVTATVPTVAETPTAPVSVAPPISPVPVMPAVPVSTSAPVSPAPAVPTAPAPTYTCEQLQQAAGRLMDRGPDAAPLLKGLLDKYQVGRVSALAPDQMGGFATDLRGLGVQI